MDGHLRDAVVYQSQHASVDSICDEQAARSTLVQATANGDKQRSANATTDGNELNLTVVQAALEVVGILSDLAILEVDDVVAVVSVRRVGDIFLLGGTLLPERHDGR